MKTFLALLLSTVSLFAQTNGVTVTWESAGPRFLFYVGSESRSYHTKLTFTNNLAWVAPDVLHYGTNYIAVEARGWNSNEEFVFSDFSEEKRVVRTPGPGIRINVGIQASTNLSDWKPFTNFVIAINPTRPVEFFKPAIEMLPPEPDVITTLPPPAVTDRHYRSTP